MAAEIPAVPTLIQRHIFGLKSDVRNHLHYLEDHVVVYSAGHCVVVYNLETKQQRFIHGSNLHGPQGRTEIVAMDVSPNKRYIAISERSERAQVLIYDARTLKRRKTLTTSDCVSREYVCVAFSPDSKSILTLGGGPDNVLINWQWQKKQSHTHGQVGRRRGGDPVFVLHRRPHADGVDWVQFTQILSHGTRVAFIASGGCEFTRTEGGRLCGSCLGE